MDRHLELHEDAAASRALTRAQLGVTFEGEARVADPGQAWRLFLTTGVLGGFTTFSTFSLETVLLFERGASLAALAYVLMSVACSIAIRHFACISRTAAALRLT